MKTPENVAYSAGMFLMLAVAVVLGATAPAAEKKPPAFDVLVVGVQGGLLASDSSAFFVRSVDQKNGIFLDAGSVVDGLRAATKRGTAPGTVQQNINFVSGYFVSHAHLDHVLGFAMASPNLPAARLYGLDETLRDLAHHLFNWKLWPNLFNEGPAPALNHHRYVPMEPGAPMPVAGTDLTVSAWPLDHAGRPSTAFVVENSRAALVYCGDTGPDRVQHSTRLAELWRAVAPQVRRGRLQALFIESSYGSHQPDDQLFGHLTPAWILAELQNLAHAAGAENLRGLTVVVTHIKPDFESASPARASMLRELTHGNTLGVHFLMPSQGDRLRL